MTRFARAKGSKSSNERAPLDSTPWEVMKDQLLQAKKENDESKNRQEAEKQRIENYENFLKERKVQKRKATWCDFPDSGGKAIDVNSTQNGSPVKKKKKKQKVVNDSAESMPANPEETAQNIVGNNNSEGSSLKQKKKKKSHAEAEAAEETAQNIGDNNSEGSSLKQKRKKKSHTEAETENKQTEKDTAILTEPGKIKKKKQKKQFNKIDTTLDRNQSDTVQEQDTNATANNDTPNKANKQQPKGNKKKKMINGQPVRRKEINDHSFQLIINGKEVELIRFDGFPVMKKDAERLQELKTSMIKKGIPKSEVQRTMKLERRRAEKALARVKRDVCYNCRKGGHVLSDCPELKSKIPSMDTAEGVCFKCGSTEHRQFECKVQRDKEFRFATCFICKEAGHIARQCPDNPKGLYPNGGSCKLCGDVTHLRKDCPTVNDKREESNIKLQTLDATDNLEDVEHQSKPVTLQVNKKPKKIMF